MVGFTSIARLRMAILQNFSICTHGLGEIGTHSIYPSEFPSGSLANLVLQGLFSALLAVFAESAI